MENQQNPEVLGVLADDPELAHLDPTDAQTLLTTTQRARLKLIAKMTTVKGYEEDSKAISNVLKALDGIDKQTLGLKRLQVDEGVGNRQAMAIEAMMSVFNDPDKLAKLTDAADQAVTPRRNLIEVPDDAELITQVPGEMEPIGKQEDYDSFMKRMSSVIEDAQQ